MRYNDSVKKNVRELRANGNSLHEIKAKTSVPITTIRTWIGDIILTSQQVSILKQKTMTALQEGNKKAKQQRQSTRKLLVDKLLLVGKKETAVLTKKELFIAGIALYWAEGFKNSHERRLGFCNTDPAMMQFYITWLKECLGVEQKNLIARLTLNKSYENKTKKIETYWSQLTGIPLAQFTKPFYQDSIWKKQFNTDNYHGVLRIHVKDSLEHLLKMKGWIEGLKLHVLK